MTKGMEKEMDMRRATLHLALLAWLSSCGLHLPVEVSGPAAEPAGNGAVSISVENFTPSALRTIAPGHIGVADLGDQAQYELVLTGTTGYQTLPPRTVTLTNGRTTLPDMPEGLWELTLTAYSRTGSRETLRGGTLVSVTPMEVTPASFTLQPLLAEDGTVEVRFVLSKPIMERLDKTTGNQATITVALYDILDVEVPGTKTEFRQGVPQAGNVTLTYNANDTPVPAGRYTIKLKSSYTGPGPAGGTSTKYEMGFQDILYVEGNRNTSATIELTSTGKELGTPDNPYRRDKTNASVTAGGPNFTQSVPSNPAGECVWLYGTAWDGNDSDTNGNEILVVDWDDVYNADWYEVEVLVHPFTKNASPATANGKFDRVVTTDAAWEALKSQQFSRNGQRKTPSYMRYSGNPSDSDYYRRKSYVISCNDGAQFLSCADKNLAKTLFTSNGAAVGKANAAYRISGTDSFDSYGTYSYRGVDRGKVGLEKGCGVIGILVPAFSPQASLVFRVRAVNQYGHSDWVYWKGGKW